VQEHMQNQYFQGMSTQLQTKKSEVAVFVEDTVQSSQSVKVSKECGRKTNIWRIKDIEGKEREGNGRKKTYWMNQVSTISELGKWCPKWSRQKPVYNSTKSTKTNNSKNGNLNKPSVLFIYLFVEMNNKNTKNIPQQCRQIKKT
jgi:hypothetical protein